MAELYRIQNKRSRLFGINSTLLLIILNVIIFFIVLIISSFFSKITDYLALTPSLIVQGKYLWTLITSIFVHASFAHLFFNMISLFFLGTLVEKIVGRKKFLKFYLLSGIFAGLFFALLSGFFGSGIGERIFGDSSISGAGASGAIFGLVGVLTILIPKKKISLILGPLIAIIFQAVFGALLPKNSFLGILDVLISIYVMISIFSVISFNPRIQKIALPVEMPFWILPIVSIIPLIVIGLFVSLPIGNTAHLGGFIIGIFYGLYLKNKYKNKITYLRSYLK
ncbi:Rhomboid protease GlpG [uncultured archaeon]|nr:Rhomboid protease GlpG [uncultured archaeon]